MALSISTDDIGKALVLVHTQDTEVDYYLAKLTLVNESNNVIEKGYFSTPAEGNKVLENGDADWEYSVIE